MWGFADAIGWSRVTHSVLHGWTAGKSLQPVEQNLPRGNREPKGWCCEGLLRTATYAVQRWCSDGRPVSHVTIALLAWRCRLLAAEQKLVMIGLWNHPAWHISRKVPSWVRACHLPGKWHGGVGHLAWCLPVKSPGRNPIAPYGVHGKRANVEPTQMLTVREVRSFISAYVGGKPMAHLTYRVA